MIYIFSGLVATFCFILCQKNVLNVAAQADRQTCFKRLGESLHTFRFDRLGYDVLLKNGCYLGWDVLKLKSAVLPTAEMVTQKLLCRSPSLK